MKNIRSIQQKSLILQNKKKLNIQRKDLSVFHKATVRNHSVSVFTLTARRRQKFYAADLNCSSLSRFEIMKYIQFLVTCLVH